MDNKTFGSLIANGRKELGLTQLQLADILGVTDRAVSKWECGLSYPDVTLIPKISTTLGISLDELMSGGSPQNPSILKVDPPKPQEQHFGRIVAVGAVVGVVLAVIFGLLTPWLRSAPEEMSTLSFVILVILGALTSVCLGFLSKSLLESVASTLSFGLTMGALVLLFGGAFSGNAFVQIPLIILVAAGSPTLVGVLIAMGGYGVKCLLNKWGVTLQDINT